MSNEQDHLKLLGRLERHMDDLIGVGFFGEHVAMGCRLCRAHRIHDSLVVLYRLCEEQIDGSCDRQPKQCGGPIKIDTSTPPGPQWSGEQPPSDRGAEGEK